MMRPAAQFLGGDDRAQTDRAVADHRDSVPGLHFGGDGRVPPGAHDVGAGQQTGDVLFGGLLGGGDQGAVGQWDPDPLGLAAFGADELAVQAVGLVAVPAVGTGVVGCEERADDELARLDRVDVAADLLDDADVLVTERGGPVDPVDAAVVPQVRAAHTGRGGADDRVGRFDDLRVVALLEAHVPGSVQNSSAHDAVSLHLSRVRVSGGCWCASRRTGRH